MRSSQFVFAADVKAAVLAGVVLTVRCAQQAGNVQFVAGILAMAEHNAIALGANWPAILKEARCALGADTAALIDAAMQLDDGL